MEDNAGLAIAILGGWLCIGVVLALVLGRRGHDTVSWFVLGALLGPLAVVFAADAVRHEDRRPRQLQGSRPRPGRRPGLDILIGFDGSPEALACIVGTVELLGTQVRNLTIATVVPFDGGAESEDRASALLAGITTRVVGMAGVEPHLLVLHGHPATALIDQALADGASVLAIGTRGTGHRLLGSTAIELADDGRVPVLLLGTR